MKYPEKIPSNNSIDSFNFSFSQINSAEKNLVNDLQKISDRISKIVDSEKFYINGFPVIKQILMLDPTASDLKKLSKALERLADLIPISNDLESKKTFINVAKDNPNWLAVAFGDFSKEIDNDISTLFEEE